MFKALKLNIIVYFFQHVKFLTLHNFAISVSFSFHFLLLFWWLLNAPAVAVGSFIQDWF